MSSATVRHDRRAMLALALGGAVGTRRVDAAGVAGAGPMAYIHNAPESARDTRYRYHIEVMRAALDRTVAQAGPYVLRSAGPMSQARQVAELRQRTGRLTVIVRGYNPDYAREFRRAAASLDRGVLGYRALLIRRADQPRFSKVRSLQDLAAIPIGQGSTWKDVDILRANGLQVVTGTSYEGLFEMLAVGRFDAFSRGIDEIGDELDQHRAALPALGIERDLLLHYPVARHAWFARDAQGEILAARLETGVRAIAADGTLDRLFRQFFGARLAALALPRRRLISLANPFLPADVAAEDASSAFVPGGP